MKKFIITIINVLCTLNMTTWENSVALEADSSISSILPKVKINAVNNALSVWAEENEFGEFSIYSKSYDSNLGQWSEGILVGSKGIDIRNISLDFNDNGSGVVVWEQLDEINHWNYLWGSLYVNGSWTEAYQIAYKDPYGYINCQVPVVKMNNSGSAVSLYECDDLYDNKLYSITANSNGTWGAPVLLDTSIAVGPPSMDMDSSGNIVASWGSQHDSEVQGRIYTSTYTSSTGYWSSIYKIDDLIDNVNIASSNPKVIQFNNGYVVTWNNHNYTTQKNSVKFRTFNNQSGPGQVNVFNPKHMYNSSFEIGNWDFDVKTDGKGLFFWNEYSKKLTGTDSVYVTEVDFTISSGWNSSNFYQLDSGTPISHWDLKIQMNSKNNAICTWLWEDTSAGYGRVKYYANGYKYNQVTGNYEWDSTNTVLSSYNAFPYEITYGDLSFNENSVGFSVWLKFVEYDNGDIYASKYY